MSKDDIKWQALKFINKACMDGAPVTGEMIRRALKDINSDITLEDLNSKDPERINSIHKEIETVHRIVKELKTEELITVIGWVEIKPYSFKHVQITDKGEKEIIVRERSSLN